MNNTKLVEKFKKTQTMNKTMNKTIGIGKDTLGDGGNMKVELHNYERSTHNLDYIWKSTMASGTLVPFMSEIGLPEDNFEIGLNCNVMTHPTIGPLFGSYKVQLDIFQIPLRLYNGKIHMNMLGVGKEMSTIKLPQLKVRANVETLENQINPSALLSHLNIRGLGRGTGVKSREFNACGYLSYFDIYKNYYANKQEEIGVMIHNNMDVGENSIMDFSIYDAMGTYIILTDTSATNDFTISETGYASIQFSSLNTEDEPAPANILVERRYMGNTEIVPLTDIFAVFNWDEITGTLTCTGSKSYYRTTEIDYKMYIYDGTVLEPNLETPKLVTFPLSDIDNKRIAILTHTANSTPYVIDYNDTSVYGLPLQMGSSGLLSNISKQEGLLCKTYQSDLFNNWVSTEWIDGDNGVNAISSVDTSAGSFTIDSLNLASKVYKMLNRIAISGGSYDDWLEAVYMSGRTRSIESPIYHGGLIKEVAFQEVISNTATSEQPLGTLAGRGAMTDKHKGGYVQIRVEEPSYIMGIVSLTPRLDYSQGNKWDVNLKTFDDLHKPQLDEIGYQDLITDQMAYFDTEINNLSRPIFKSAGKQPAWINYMTNVNITRGNFAEENEQMFMTLNRRYERDGNAGIKDLTTYIDPSKFNNIFADTRLDAQNFWTQIKVDMKVRRKMSAKQIPNL